MFSGYGLAETQPAGPPGAPDGQVGVGVGVPGVGVGVGVPPPSPQV